MDWLRVTLVADGYHLGPMLTPRLYSSTVRIPKKKSPEISVVPEMFFFLKRKREFQTGQNFKSLDAGFRKIELRPTIELQKSAQLK